MNMRTQIRIAILKQEKPFCNQDITNRLKSITTDKSFILNVLDELYRENLVDYRQNNNIWCWNVC